MSTLEQAPGTATQDMERFVDDTGRKELVKKVRKKIDELGIDYLYLQFVSVTGRIMGKGIPADHWESVAKKGFQLVYGATMNLFLNRRGEYLGYGPEAAELDRHSRAGDLHAAPLGQAGGATCGARCSAIARSEQEPGAFLTADAHGDLRRIHDPIQKGARAGAPARHRAGDDVAEEGRAGAAGGRVFPIPIAIISISSRACGRSILRVIDYCRKMGLDMIQGDHEGFARPARAEFHL